MPGLTLLSPAKLNLLLHITGRRPDGYHTLQTMFQLLDYGDMMEFSPGGSSDINLVCDCASIPLEDNLVFRAARLLQDQSRTAQGATIILHKSLPMGAGLGGGSSNAATTLLALNKLWELNLDLSHLARLGLQLGADVPVFVMGNSAWAEGIGEKLHKTCLPEQWFAVVTPPCHTSTVEIFSHQQLTRTTSPIKIPGFPFLDCKNDCEPVARLLHPEIGIALDYLSAYGQARMTGTGSSVFAGFAEKHQAEAALAQLDTVSGSYSGFVARGVNVSPVHKALQIQA